MNSYKTSTYINFRLKRPWKSCSRSYIYRLGNCRLRKLHSEILHKLMAYPALGIQCSSSLFIALSLKIKITLYNRINNPLLDLPVCNTKNSEQIH